MKPHATKPMTESRRRLLAIQEKINQNPHHYTREKLDIDMLRNGYDITTMIHDAAKMLGMRDIIAKEQRHAIGLLQFINRILEETLP